MLTVYAWCRYIIPSHHDYHMQCPKTDPSGQCEAQAGYVRSWDYLDIVAGNQPGVWAVPLVLGALLLDQTAMLVVGPTFPVLSQAY